MIIIQRAHFPQSRPHITHTANGDTKTGGQIDSKEWNQQYAHSNNHQIEPNEQNSLIDHSIILNHTIHFHTDNGIWMLQLQNLGLDCLKRKQNTITFNTSCSWPRTGTLHGKKDNQ